MSTDTFEGELRSLLHDTADAEGPAYVDVDPNAVVTQGRRVVRRRRMAAGAGVAAATLVLGAGAWAVLDQGSRRQGWSPCRRPRSASAGPPTSISTRAPSRVEGNPRVAVATPCASTGPPGRVTASRHLCDRRRRGFEVPIGHRSPAGEPTGRDLGDPLPRPRSSSSASCRWPTS